MSVNLYSSVDMYIPHLATILVLFSMTFAMIHARDLFSHSLFRQLSKGKYPKLPKQVNNDIGKCHRPTHKFNKEINRFEDDSTVRAVFVSRECEGAIAIQDLLLQRSLLDSV